jgi:ABC-type transport system involved in multi-copper enzyme maturation permease subunit
MMGPVLRQELLLSGRRQRLYVFRWVYAGWLVVLLIYCYAEFFSRDSQRHRVLGDETVIVNPISAPQVVGARFVELFLYQQLLMLGLAIPTLVAGAVTDEKRSGTLQYLLTAHLDGRHIVLGKLLARTAVIALLALTGLPPFALLGGFGGVGPFTMALVPVVLIIPVLGLAAAALLISVWSRTTVDAVIGTYVLEIVIALVVWGLGLSHLNPLFVVEPARGSWAATDVAEVGRRLLSFFLAWIAFGGVCLGLAVWRLRPAYVRQLEGGSATSSFWYGVERESVSDDPVHWRERHVEGLAPLRTLRRFPQWLGVVAISLATTVSSLAILWGTMPPGASMGDVVRAGLRFDGSRLRTLLPGAEIGFLIQSLVVLALAGLVVAVRCSGAVTGEREKQTWESLLTSPLSGKEMVGGKLWGVTGASYWYLLAYGAPAVTISVLGGVLAFFWTLLWLGVTVLAMYFVGAAGLYCSARGKSSWRSLLATLGMAYGGGAVVFLVTGVLSVLPAGVLYGLLVLGDSMFGTQMATFAARGMNTFVTLCFIAVCGVLAAVFWLLSRKLLEWAADWVTFRERTRHWPEPPVYRRSRRRGVGRRRSSLRES